MDARRTPQRIRGRHLDDHSPQFRIQRWASGAVAPGAPRPASADPVPMPSDHGLRFHQDKGRAPALPRHWRAIPKTSDPGYGNEGARRVAASAIAAAGPCSQAPGLGVRGRPRGLPARSTTSVRTRRDCGVSGSANQRGEDGRNSGERQRESAHGEATARGPQGRHGPKGQHGLRAAVRCNSQRRR